MEATIPAEKLGLILKVGFFVLLAVLGVAFIAPLAYAMGGYLIGAALGTFAAAAIANAVTIRVFERGNLADIGLNWRPGWFRNLLLGISGGLVAALTVVGGPILCGAAVLEKTPDQPGSFASLLFVTVCLIFGAVGEEMLFRGYAFQVLLGSLGTYATILPTSILFGWVHLTNQNASMLGIVNTVGFGIVLGYAFVRSGDLWLPIGIHFAWNWMLPILGVSLSGFTMGTTGYAVRWKVGDIWSGGAYGPEASLLTSAIVVGLMVFLHNAPVRTQTPLLLARRAEQT